MGWLNDRVTNMPLGARLAGGAALIAIGVGLGAGAVSWTRPANVMAPTAPTAIGKLAMTSGIVTVKGRVTDAFGDRFVLEDRTGRTLVDAGRADTLAVVRGDTVTAQGRYENSQLRASYLIDGAGKVVAVLHRGREHRGRHHGPTVPEAQRTDPAKVIVATPVSGSSSEGLAATQK